MARHKGNNGIVKSGSTTLGDVVEFDIEETAEAVDMSGLNDEWDENDSGSKAWSGNVTLRFNTADAEQNALRAGSKLTVSLYSEGDGSGKQYFSGAIIVTTTGIAVTRNTTVDKSVAFTGSGALSTATVA